MKMRFRDSYAAYSLMMGFFFLGSCLYSALISVYLLDMGFSPSQVSFVVAAAQLATLLINPQTGVLRSRFGGRRINLILLLLAISSSLLFAVISSYWLVVLVYALGSVGLNCTNPMIDRLALQSPYAYGKIRIFGCVGAAFGMQVSGLIYDYISPQAVYLFTAMNLAVCIAGLSNVVDRQENVSRTVRKGMGQGVYKPLLSNRRFLYYLLIVFLFYGPNNTSHTYSAAMLVDEGLAVSLASTICFGACLLEIPFVLLSNHYLDRLSNKNLLLLLMTAFLAGTLTRGSGIGLPAIIPATILTKHLPGMVFIMTNMKIVSTVVEEKDQVLALTVTYTVQSLSSVICVNVAGKILDVSTYGNMFLFCSASVLAAILLVLFFKLPKGNEKALFT